MKSKCRFCGVQGFANRMPFLFIGDEKTHTCKREACREAARAEMRGDRKQVAA